MTTEQLVNAFIEALSDTDRAITEVEQEFARFHPRRVRNTEDVTVWSIALNDQTRDVRYVSSDGGIGEVVEVFPRTVMRTVYVSG